jgi:hypothetical protein
VVVGAIDDDGNEVGLRAPPGFVFAIGDSS